MTDKEREERTLEWLADGPEPSVRYIALTELLGRKPSHPAVRRARSELAKVGWAKNLLRGQKREGYWEDHEPRKFEEYLGFLRFPVFKSSVWRGMVLAELGLTESDPRIRRLGERVFQYLLPLGSPLNIYIEEVCIVGNVAAMMTRFGFGEDRRVQKLHEWMIEDQRENGGWHCVPGLPGSLDAWEALAAFSTVSKAKRSAAMSRAIERGAEFYLERRLFDEGRRYAPWFRFHYPTHYYYDILVGLDVLTRLGYAGDRRLKPALEVLLEKRQRDGRWLLDRIHPDEIPVPTTGFGGRPISRLALEREGAPSRWITLTALRVLKRVADEN